MVIATTDHLTPAAHSKHLKINNSGTAPDTGLGMVMIFKESFRNNNALTLLYKQVQFHFTNTGKQTSAITNYNYIMNHKGLDRRGDALTLT